MMRLLAPLRSFLALAALLMALSAVSPAAAQTPTNTPGSGCCLCLLCPGSSGFCTEGQTSTACATACGTLACDGFVFGFGEPCVNGSCSMVFPPTETPTPTATATATETDTPTATDTATETQTVTETPTVTDTPTPADTATVTDTPTVTLTPTTTDTPTPEDTPTATGTVTSTATPSDSPTVTGTATGTNTSTPTVTPSSTPTVTNTRTVTNTATATFTATPTNTATSTRTVTNTPTITNTATQTPTRTATPTNTPRPPLIGGLEPGDDTVDGSGQPNCNMLFVCALPPGGSTPSMTQPCGAPDTQIGSGSSNGSGSFSIPVTPAIGVNQCIYVYDQCNDIIGPVACARAAAPAPAMSPRMTIVAMLVLGAVALLSLLRLRRDI